jgi:hypothetical protein
MWSRRIVLLVFIPAEARTFHHRSLVAIANLEFTI